MMLTIEEIKERVRPICEHYKIDRMWLFGSYARGEADEQSDVDLCIEGGEFHGWEYGGVYIDLEDSLGVPISLIDRADVRERSRRYMQENEVLIYDGYAQ
ncbi:MAG: nucleotidyltransferase domain-containing protein [Selenomonadaceae bacterium]|nr:nucleotidyltransferase domain-containing protein [Selenomonadaceae bacterium]